MSLTSVSIFSVCCCSRYLLYLYEVEGKGGERAEAGGRVRKREVLAEMKIVTKHQEKSREKRDN
jgi:hypothetical protein